MTHNISTVKATQKISYSIDIAAVQIVKHIQQLQASLLQRCFFSLPSLVSHAKQLWVAVVSLRLILHARD